MVTALSLENIRRLVSDVRDPEIPILTIADLGILRDLYFDDDVLTVEITPTYVGCPAMDTIGSDIKECLHDAGLGEVRIKTRLAPAWTTDWLSVDGRRKLLEIGIAPPVAASSSKKALFADNPVIACPQCSSTETECISEFGSTACKALYRCKQCLEPFDYFKCI